MLKDWGRLLKQYLKGSEEQVDLLLTLEEFCSEEPPFGPSSQGKRFILVFARVSGSAIFADRHLMVQPAAL